MQEEVWKDIAGYEGKYQVSNCGRVCNVKSGRILALEISQRGYLRVGLSLDGRQSKHKVHRLVGLSFVDNPYNLPQIHHIDENKQNNNAENLVWVDNKTNNDKKTDKSTKRRGVIVTNADGKEVFFKSQRRAAAALGVSRYGVMAACNGTQKTSGGKRIRFM